MQRSDVYAVDIAILGLDTLLQQWLCDQEPFLSGRNWSGIVEGGLQGQTLHCTSCICLI